MYAVVINEGPVMADDNAVYFTPEMPTFEAVEVPCEGAEPSRVVLLRFTPTNGYAKGKLMRVPYGRVVAISDEAPQPPSDVAGRVGEYTG